MLDQEERTRLAPVQRQVLEDLLAVDAPRPLADLEVSSRLRAQLDAGLAEVAPLLPHGYRPLVLGKSMLDTLNCDGRFLDHLDTPFAWAPAMVAGTLAHTGIAVDLAGGWARDPGEVVRHAWQAFATSGTPAGRYLAELEGAEADALRGRARNLIVEFREIFPPLPDWVTIRTEPELAAPLLDGRIVLRGKPDLAIGRALYAQRRRLLLVDLKTGRRNALRDHADMRFYALLATLKYGVAPFRVATFYLDEAGWGCRGRRRRRPAGRHPHHHRQGPPRGAAHLRPPTRPRTAPRSWARLPLVPPLRGLPRKRVADPSGDGSWIANRS